MRALRLLVALAIVSGTVALPAVASANDNAQTAVAGANSKWYSGTLLQLPGENCSTLGDPITETMVSAISEYGGAPNGNIPSVGQPYYVAILISIPGNPCGPGSSVVGTDVALPNGTTVDTSRPIRCFGEPRGQSSFVELTGGNWGPFNGYTGPYCPTTVGPSLTGNAGVAVGVGFRPLASGQLYELFVPVKSTQQLIGAGNAPPDQTIWFLAPSGTYSNIGETSVWTNVLSGSPTSPFIYFARNPSAQPYWVANPTDMLPKSRVELFANLYSAGKAGTFCWALYEPDPAHDSAPFRCTDPTFAPGWNSAITSASDTWQVTGPGPNGGYGFAFDPMIVPPGQMFTMRWIFTPTSPPGPPVSKDITFNMLDGPDTDGDGVPDTVDACPAVKGTQSNGCQPPVQTDPDGDGIYGAADKCPTQNGTGSLDGCPAPDATTTTTTIQTIPKPPLQPPKLKTGRASAALKGSIIVVTTGLSVACPAGGPSCPVSLTGTISGAQAAKAKKKKPKPLTVGSARLTVAAGKTVAITFKLSSKAKSLLAKHHRLTIALAGSATTGPGGPKTQIKKSISVSNPPKRKSKHH